MPSRGFTLVELLVVMTIGAILVAAAVPSMSYFIATTRTSNATNTMVASFELARSEAIRRNTIVSVCRTLDPNATEPLHFDHTGHPAANRFALARAKRSHVHAFGMDWDDTSGRNNGQYAPFAWQGG